MTVNGLLTRLYDVIVRPVIMLLFAVAFLLFIYGIFQFIKNVDDEGERATGKRNMLYGIIGMVIMVSVFGIIRIIHGTIGSNEPLPSINEQIEPQVEGGI